MTFISNTPTKTRQFDLLSLSFYHVFDEKQSHSTLVNQYIEQYNATLPSAKGKLGPGETAIAQTLVHWAFKSMEALRKEKIGQLLYQNYLSKHSKSFPVISSPTAIQRRVSCRTVRTIQSYINKLIKAKIIITKVNNSVDRDWKQILFDAASNDPDDIGGRGHVLYFINRELFSKNFIISQKSHDMKAVLLPDFQKTENESFRSLQDAKLPQHNDISNPNIIIKKNKELKGVDKPQSVQSTAIAADGDDSRRNKGGMLSQTETSEALAYREKLIKINKISRALPEKPIDLYATLLFSQAKEFIYSKRYSETQMSQLENSAKNLLRLHLTRFEQDLDEAFRQISRGIFLTARHLHKNENAFVYGILQWLSLDNSYVSGTLKYVIDNWVSAEDKRFKHWNQLNRTKVSKQYAFQQKERLYMAFIKALKKDFSLGLATMKRNYKQLAHWMQQNAIDEAYQQEMLSEFRSRTLHILNDLNQLGDTEIDKTYKTFERYRKELKSAKRQARKQSNFKKRS